MLLFAPEIYANHGKLSLSTSFLTSTIALHFIKGFAAYLFELGFIPGLVADEYLCHFSVIYVCF